MNTGQMAFNGPAAPVRTYFDVPAGHSMSDPVFGPSGDFYVIEGVLSNADPQDILVAYSPSGTRLWSWLPNRSGQPDIEGLWLQPPSVGADGTVYEPSIGGPGPAMPGITALNPADGAVEWQTSVPDTYGAESAPTIGPDGTIYLQDLIHVDAIDPNGKGIEWSWSVPPGTEATCSMGPPVLSPDGSTVYAGGGDGSLSAIRNGVTIWTRPPVSPGDCIGRPAVATDGMLFLTDGLGNTGDLTAVEPDGKTLWTSAVVPWAANGGPALTSTGTVVIERVDGYICAWNSSTGKELWGYWPDQGTYASQISPGSPVIVGADGTIFAGDNFQVTAYSPDGKPEWVLPMPGVSAGDYRASISPSGALFVAYSAANGPDLAVMANR